MRAHRTRLRIITALAAIMLSLPIARAQVFGIKTNLLSDAFMNVNLGVEAGLSPRWTLEAEAQINDWTLSHGRRWKHWAVQPEARYWFCSRFSGHFVGIHVHGGQFNMYGFDGKPFFWGNHAESIKDTRYQGWFAGAGVSYGYAWALGKHWSMEAEIGVGYSYTKYDRYGEDECTGCKNQKQNEGKEHHHYVGPTRAALNLVYLF